LSIKKNHQVELSYQNPQSTRRGGGSGSAFVKANIIVERLSHHRAWCHHGPCWIHAELC